MLSSVAFYAQPLNFSPMGTGGGGALFAPSISPYNSDELYMVCDMAGVFHSLNAGQSWEMFHYDELISTTRAKVQFTSDSNILYTLRQMEGSGFRLYPVKSTDGGASWQALTNPSESLYWYLYADPNSTERLIICTYDGILLSLDGGATFNEIYHDNDEALYVAGTFWDGDDIYIGMDRGLLVSNNGGANFEMDETLGLPNGTGFFSFAGTKENGIVRLMGTCASTSALVMETESYHFYPDELFGLYQLDYGLGNWVKNGSFNNGEVPYLVDMPKGDIETVYVVANRIDDLPNVYKSADGGASWENTFLTINNQNIATGYAGYWGDFSWYWGGPALAMDVSDTDPNHVVVTDFGFVHGTQDGGETWRQLYVEQEFENESGSPTPELGNYKGNGLNQTTSHWITWLNEEEIFVAYTDVSCQYTANGGDTWTFARDHFLTSNTYAIKQQPGSDRLYAIISELNDVYLPYRLSDDDIDNAPGAILISDNKGVNWEVLYDFNRLPVWLTFSPFNPEHLYVSIAHTDDGGIYKSEDEGESWEKLADPPRTEGRANSIRVLSDGSLVASFSARDANGNDNFSASSGVFYSVDDGESWEDRSHSEMMHYTLEVVIDPNNENVWYATVADHFNNFGVVEYGGAFKTTDRGLNWERIHQYGFTHSVSVHPENSDVLYITRENGGLYYCENATDDNPIITKVDAYPYARPKRVFFNPFDVNEVWVSTMGGAIWKGTVETDVVSIQHIDAIVEVICSPNPIVGEGVLAFELPISGEVKIEVFNALGQVVYVVEKQLEAGYNQLNFSTDDFGGEGLYHFTISHNGFRRSGKVVVAR